MSLDKPEPSYNELIDDLEEFCQYSDGEFVTWGGDPAHHCVFYQDDEQTREQEKLTVTRNYDEYGRSYTELLVTDGGSISANITRIDIESSSDEPIEYPSMGQNEEGMVWKEVGGSYNPIDSTEVSDRKFAVRDSRGKQTLEFRL